MTRRRWGLVGLLALIAMLWASAATALEAGQVPLSLFRMASADAQRGMVAGAMAVTDVTGVACARPGTVAEYVAALMHRQLDPAMPWITALLRLMDERGCTLPEEITPNAPNT